MQPPGPNDPASAWVAAGIITADQARAINDFEARRGGTAFATPSTDAATASTPSATVQRAGITEVAITMGVVLALAGVYAEVHINNTSTAVNTGFDLVIALVAGLSAYRLRNSTDYAMARACSNLAALCIAAIGGAILEFCTGTGFLITTETGRDSFYATTSPWLAILADGIIVSALSLVAMRRFRSGLSTLLYGLGLLAIALAFINNASNNPEASVSTVSDFAFFFMGAALVAGAESGGVAAEFGVMRFLGVVIPVIALVAGDNTPWIAPTALAAAIAMAALFGGERYDRSGILVGGATGIAIVIIAIGARTIESSIGFPVYLALCGLGIVAAVVAIRQFLMQRETTQPTTPAQ